MTGARGRENTMRHTTTTVTTVTTTVTTVTTTAKYPTEWQPVPGVAAECRFYDETPREDGTVAVRFSTDTADAFFAAVLVVAAVYGLTPPTREAALETFENTEDKLRWYFRP
jgi:hypothetical protein